MRNLPFLSVRVASCSCQLIGERERSPLEYMFLLLYIPSATVATALSVFLQPASQEAQPLFRTVGKLSCSLLVARRASQANRASSLSSAPRKSRIFSALTLANRVGRASPSNMSAPCCQQARGCEQVSTSSEIQQPRMQNAMRNIRVTAVLAAIVATDPRPNSSSSQKQSHASGLKEDWKNVNMLSDRQSTKGTRTYNQVGSSL